MREVTKYITKTRGEDAAFPRSLAFSLRAPVKVMVPKSMGAMGAILMKI